MRNFHHKFKTIAQLPSYMHWYQQQMVLQLKMISFWFLGEQRWCHDVSVLWCLLAKAGQENRVWCLAGNKAIKQYSDTITKCFSCISGIIYFVTLPWVGVTQCRVVTVGSQTFRIKQRSLCRSADLPTITPKWRLGSFSTLQIISDHDFLSLQKYFLCFTILPLYLISLNL